jgi:hypothetical protein
MIKKPGPKTKAKAAKAGAGILDLLKKYNQDKKMKVTPIKKPAPKKPAPPKPIMTKPVTTTPTVAILPPPAPAKQEATKRASTYRILGHDIDKTAVELGCFAAGTALVGLALFSKK